MGLMKTVSVLSTWTFGFGYGTIKRKVIALYSELGYTSEKYLERNMGEIDTAVKCLHFVSVDR